MRSSAIVVESGRSPQRFAATVRLQEKRRVVVPIPFNPDVVWGRKTRHHVHGTVDGMGVRAVVEPVGDGCGFVLGEAWRRDCGIAAGDQVTVVLEPEGPQRAELAPDFAGALDADPDAGDFFDSLPPFYRLAYLRWIDATKRRPQLRADRIAEVVRLLRAGRKARPGT